MEDVTKELDHRRRILSIYNKTRDDFGSKDEYDDYLEAVEDIIYKLTYNIDVTEVEQQVQDYVRQVGLETMKGPVVGAPAYVPQQVTNAVLQPAPLVPVQQDADGRLLPIVPASSISRERLQAMAKASGWTQEMANQRMLQDAFSTILVL